VRRLRLHLCLPIDFSLRSRIVPLRDSFSFFIPFSFPCEPGQYCLRAVLIEFRSSDRLWEVGYYPYTVQNCCSIILPVRLGAVSLHAYRIRQSLLHSAWKPNKAHDNQSTRPNRGGERLSTPQLGPVISTAFPSDRHHRYAAKARRK
jgi:hypothetical protein